MNILFLRGFSNYFNRIVKKYSTLEDYKAQSQSYLDLSNINFTPNDGVATELIIGSTNQTENNAPLAWDTIGTPDYAICYEMEGTPAVAVIKFRWFVLESERTRNGQYRIALKRDSIVDNFDKIISAPCFIEKGQITDVNNPLIFNKENMSFNQIKTSETLLYDQSQSAWVVAYIPRDANPGTVNADIPYTGSEDYSINGIENWTYYSYVNSSEANTYKHHLPIQVKTRWKAEVNWEGTGGNIFTRSYKGTFIWNKNENNTSSNTSESGSNVIPQYILDNSSYYDRMMLSNVIDYSNGSRKTTFDTRFWGVMSGMSSYWNTNSGYNGYCNIISESDYNSLLSLNNKIIKDTSTNKFYQINLSFGDVVDGIKVNSSTTISPKLDAYNHNSGGSAFADFWYDYSLMDSDYGTWPNFPGYQTQRVWIDLIEQHTSISMTVPAPSLRYHLEDQPYDMLCIPYHPIQIKHNNTNVCIANGISGINIATQLTIDVADAAANGGNAVYDIQLLPYCPIQNIIVGNGVIDYGNLYHSNIINTTTNDILNVCFYCSRSEFDFNIDKNIEINKELTINTSVEYDSRNIIDVVDSFTSLGQNRYEYYYTIPTSEFIGMGIPADSLETINIKNIILDDLVLDQGGMDASNITLSALREGSSWQIKINCYSQSNLATSIRIELSADIELEYLAEDRVLSLKLSNETDVYRLCSPNWSGYFDFSIAKLGGTLTGFHVDCSYKPYQPYIHVAPNFSGLYGQPKFNNSYDARGLICGGDFSLPQLSSAWSNYVLNNKNYQNIFDRQMLNLDVNNKIAMEQRELSTILGSITGGLSGGVSGAATGAAAGPWGAVAGAVVGTVGGAAGSIAAGMKDIEWLRRQQEETRSFQTDMFGYQLQNIQAIPTSLAKISAYNPNNKLFPILEKYTSTDIEKEILKNKIKYDGMTIMAISSLDNYDSGFVRGEMIRMDNLADDFHVADDIYAEVKKGLYLGG